MEQEVAQRHDRLTNCRSETHECSPIEQTHDVSSVIAICRSNYTK
jgi:hypothetical protein